MTRRSSPAEAADSSPGGTGTGPCPPRCRGRVCTRVETGLVGWQDGWGRAAEWVARGTRVCPLCTGRAAAPAPGAHQTSRMGRGSLHAPPGATRGRPRLRTRQGASGPSSRLVSAAPRAAAASAPSSDRAPRRPQRAPRASHTPRPQQPRALPGRQRPPGAWRGGCVGTRTTGRGLLAAPAARGAFACAGDRAASHACGRSCRRLGRGRLGRRAGPRRLTFLIKQNDSLNTYLEKTSRTAVCHETEQTPRDQKWQWTDAAAPEAARQAGARPAAAPAPAPRHVANTTRKNCATRRYHNGVSALGKEIRASN